MKPNMKPFWKEPSLAAVWARTNSGARILIYVFLTNVLILGVLFAAWGQS